MLDVVKFTWRNRYGYWIPVAWTMTPTDRDEPAIRGYASIGRPGMTELKVLDRATIPEELRMNGRSRYLLSSVILHNRAQADEYTAQQMIEAMTAWTA